MAQIDPTNKKFTSGFVVGDVTAYIEAAKISTDTYGVAESWPATIDSANSGFVPTISAVKSEIDNKIGGVYKVKETITAIVDENGFITNMPTNAENGDVHNIALHTGTSSAKIGTAEKYETVTNGDNVVYIVTGEGETATGAWDKLAGAVDTETFATKAWVNDGTTDGSLPMQMISGAYTASAQMTATDANPSALVMNAGVKDYVGGYISDNTIKTSTALSAVSGDVERAASGEMLVGASALTGYIKDQIDTTIQKTIDIAEVLTSGMDATTTPPASAVPNAGAVTGYIDSVTIKSSADMTATDANPAGLVSNSAVKDYIANQLSAGVSAYAGIIVNDSEATNASAYNDVFKVKNGNGVTVTTDTDTAGHPTLVFNSNIGISGVAGTTTESAALTVTPSTATDGKVSYDITVPDATTDAVGVVKADYYDEDDGLIHLF